MLYTYKFLKERDEHIVLTLIKKHFGNNIPKLLVVMYQNQPFITINSPEYLNEIYNNKNKYYDKVDFV
jgi:hypothetical protein